MKSSTVYGLIGVLSAVAVAALACGSSSSPTEGPHCTSLAICCTQLSNAATTANDTSNADNGQNAAASQLASTLGEDSSACSDTEEAFDEDDCAAALSTYTTDGYCGSGAKASDGDAGEDSGGDDAGDDSGDDGGQQGGGDDAGQGAGDDAGQGGGDDAGQGGGDDAGQGGGGNDGGQQGGGEGGQQGHGP